MPQNPFDDNSALLPDGTKSLPEPKLIQICIATWSLQGVKFVPNGPNDSKSVLVQIVAQHQLHKPRIFYPSGHWPETVTNAHVSVHFH